MDTEISLQTKLRRKILIHDRKLPRKRYRNANNAHPDSSDVSSWEVREFLTENEDGLGTLLKPFLACPRKDSKVAINCSNILSIPEVCRANSQQTAAETSEPFACSSKVSERGSPRGMGEPLRQVRMILNKVSDSSLELVCRELTETFSVAKSTGVDIACVRERTANVLCLACLGEFKDQSFNEVRSEERIGIFASPYRAAYCAVVIYLHCTEEPIYGNLVVGHCIDILKKTSELHRKPLQKLLGAFTTLCFLFMGGLVAGEQLFFLTKRFLLDNFDETTFVVVLQILQICGLHLFRTHPEKFRELEQQIREACALADHLQSFIYDRKNALAGVLPTCPVSITRDVIGDVIHAIRSKSQNQRCGLQPFPRALKWINEKLGSSFIYERRVKGLLEMETDVKFHAERRSKSMTACLHPMSDDSASELKAQGEHKESARNITRSKSNVQKFLSKCGIATDIGRTVVEILMSSVNYIEAALRISRILRHEIQSRHLSGALEAIIRCYVNESELNEFYSLLLVELLRLHGQSLVAPLRRALQNVYPLASLLDEDAKNKATDRASRRIEELMRTLNQNGVEGNSILVRSDRKSRHR